MATEYVSLTDRRIATLKGHVLIFKARVPQAVPPGIEEELMAAGIVPVAVVGDVPLRTLEEAIQEEQDARTAQDEHDTAVAVAAITKKSPEFDQAVFEAAVREVIAKNDPDDLTEAGNPKVKSVEALTGFKVTPIHIRNFLKSTE
jgi:hypothetical protein